MSLNTNIRERMRALTKRDDEIYTIRAIVVTVDEDAMTCDCVPIEQGGDLLDVQLIPRDEDGEVQNGFVLIPKVGSVVFVSMLNKSDGYVSMISEVEQVYILGDKFGGLIKIEELVEKLNNLENKVNSIINTFNSHTHTVVTSCGAGAGTGTAAVTTAPITGTLTPTQKTDLENPLIKHGDAE